jgi:nucleoside-diphosphate-sugar epimerase
VIDANLDSLSDFSDKKNLTTFLGDIRDEKLISKYIRDVDYIFPLASITGAPACEKNPELAKSINLEAIKMILRIRKKNQGIIFPTTDSGYGVGERDEERPVYCDENTPLNPISLYGRLKAKAEKAILKAGNSISLRLAAVFGVSPRMRWDSLINNFVYRALKDKYLELYEPHFKRSCVHVRDVARAFIHCLNNFDQMKKEAYNVGLKEGNLTKWEICQEIKKQIPDFVFVESKNGRDPDRRNYIISYEKIEKTGFKPKVSLAEGISELIKEYQKN